MTSPTAQKPVPRPTPETQRFWDASAVGQLHLQRCVPCDAHYFPPRPFCPHKAVYILGTGESSEAPMVSQMDDLTTSRAFLVASRKAFDEAGITQPTVSAHVRRVGNAGAVPRRAVTRTVSPSRLRAHRPLRRLTRGSTPRRTCTGAALR